MQLWGQMVPVKVLLGYALSGRDGYEITGGDVSFCDKNLLDYDAQRRALEGLFLAFQYPVELAGVNNYLFFTCSL